MANVEVEVVQTAPERVIRIGCLDQIILSTVFGTSYNIFLFSSPVSHFAFSWFSTLDELGLWTLEHDNFPSCVTLSERFFYPSALFVISFILNSCLHWNYFFIKMLVTHKHRIDLFPEKNIYTIYPVAHVRSLSTYSIMSSFYCTKTILHTPKAVEIMIFMQKSLLEIMIWVVFWVV